MAVGMAPAKGAGLAVEPAEHGRQPRRLRCARSRGLDAGGAARREMSAPLLPDVRELVREERIADRRPRRVRAARERDVIADGERERAVALGQAVRARVLVDADVGERLAERRLHLPARRPAEDAPPAAPPHRPRIARRGRRAAVAGLRLQLLPARVTGLQPQISGL